MPSRDENGLEMMFRITEIIAAQSGVKVGVGTVPLNRLERARVAVAAQNELARDVLWGALKSIAPALSWQLFCDVGEKSACALNIHPARRQSKHRRSQKQIVSCRVLAAEALIRSRLSVAGGPVASGESLAI